jgi:hypothetical protein
MARRRAAPVLSPVGVHAPEIARGAELFNASPHAARRYLGIPRNATCSGLTTVQGTGCHTDSRTRQRRHARARHRGDRPRDRSVGPCHSASRTDAPRDLAAALVGARPVLRASERESRCRRSQLGSPRPTPWAEARRDRGRRLSGTPFTRPRCQCCARRGARLHPPPSSCAPLAAPGVLTRALTTARFRDVVANRSRTAAVRVGCPRRSPPGTTRPRSPAPWCAWTTRRGDASRSLFAPRAALTAIPDCPTVTPEMSAP